MRKRGRAISNCGSGRGGTVRRDVLARLAGMGQRQGGEKRERRDGPLALPGAQEGIELGQAERE